MPCSASAPQSCLVAATESPAAKKLPAYCCPCPHLSRSDQATLAVRLDERRRRASQERASQEHMMPKLMQSLTGRSRCPRRIQGTQEPAGIRIHTLCMPARLTRVWLPRPPSYNVLVQAVQCVASFCPRFHLATRKMVQTTANACTRPGSACSVT